MGSPLLPVTPTLLERLEEILRRRRGRQQPPAAAAVRVPITPDAMQPPETAPAPTERPLGPAPVVRGANRPRALPPSLPETAPAMERIAREQTRERARAAPSTHFERIIAPELERRTAAVEQRTLGPLGRALERRGHPVAAQYAEAARTGVANLVVRPALTMLQRDPRAAPSTRAGARAASEALDVERETVEAQRARLPFGHQLGTGLVQTGIEWAGLSKVPGLGRLLGARAPVVRAGDAYRRLRQAGLSASLARRAAQAGTVAARAGIRGAEDAAKFATFEGAMGVGAGQTPSEIAERMKHGAAAGAAFGAGIPVVGAVAKPLARAALRATARATEPIVSPAVGRITAAYQRRATDRLATRWASAHALNQGATFEARTGQSAAGKPFIAVSAFKDRQRVLDHPPSPDELRAFVTTNADLTRRPGVGVGSWYNEQDGKHYVDVVLLERKDKVSREVIDLIANRFGQHATFDLEGMRELPAEWALRRYAKGQGWTEIRPEEGAQRTGIPGAETRRRLQQPDVFPPRAYLTRAGVRPEALVEEAVQRGGLTEYEVRVPGTRAYDISVDPEGLFQRAGGDVTKLERLLAESDKYDVYWASTYNPQVVAALKALPAREVTAEMNAALERAVTAARARLAERGLQFAAAPGGVPPQLPDWAIIGAARLARGVTRYRVWAKQMAEELGDAVTPHLARVWEQANTAYLRMLATAAKGGGLPTRSRLEALAARGKPGEAFYEASGAEIEAFMGDLERVGRGIIAATSPQSSVKSNTTRALRILTRWLETGQPPTRGALAPALTAIRTVLAGGVPGGPKVNPFFEALGRGAKAPDQVVVDQWMARIFFGRDEVTPKQIEFISAWIRQEAQRLGTTPRRLQAALWLGIKLETEGPQPLVNFQTAMREYVSRGMLDGFLERMGERAPASMRAYAVRVKAEGAEPPTMLAEEGVRYRRAADADWPVPFQEGETRPLMSGQDYVLYHGTAQATVPKLTTEGFRGDNLGSVGLTTHPSDAGMFGTMKAGRRGRSIVEVVIDGDWLRAERRIRREGNHAGMWLVGRGRQGDVVIPPEAIKAVRPFEDWEAVVEARPEAARSFRDLPTEAQVAEQGIAGPASGEVIVQRSEERLAAMRAGRRQPLPDLRGLSLKQPERLAGALRAARHPQSERLNAIIHDAETGEVLSHTIDTSGAINAVKPADRYIADLIRRVRRLQAKHPGRKLAVTLAHNHPSGIPEPSHADVVMTARWERALRQAGVALRGHLVIDDRTFSLIEATPTRTGDYSVRWRPGEMRGPLGGPKQDWARPGAYVHGAEEVAALVRRMDPAEPGQFNVLYLDNRGKVVAVEPHSFDALEKLSVWLPQRTRAHGAVNAILVHSDAERGQVISMAGARAVAEGAPVRDVVWVGEHGAYSAPEVAELTTAVRAARGEGESTRTARRLREEPAEYERRRTQPPQPVPPPASTVVPSEALPFEEATGIGPRPGAPPPGRRGPSDIQTDEYANFAKFDLDPSGEVRLRGEVERVVQQYGLHPKRRVTHAETIQRAKELGIQIERLGVPVNRRLSGAEALAIRNIVSRNTEQLERLYSDLAELERGKGTTETIATARHRIQSLETQNANLLERFIPERSAAGRLLNSYRILANRTLDPVVWLEKAKAMVGDGGWTEEVRTEVQRLLATGDREGLFRYLSRARLSTRGEKLITLWKAGLLTNPMTHGVNIASNTTMAMMETLKDIPAAFADRLIVLAQQARGLAGRRTKGAPLLRTVGASVRGAGQGLREAIQVMRGRDPSFLERYDFARETNYDSLILNAYTKGIFRSLGAQDRFFRAMALKRSLTEQAVVLARAEGKRGVQLRQRIEELVRAPTDEMATRGMADAEHAVFQNQTRLGEAASKVARTFGVAGEIVLPFKRTPGAVATSVLEYSPLGLAVGLKRVVGQMVARQPTPAAQRAAAELFGRGATGTSLVLLGYWLADQDLATGSYPANSRERNRWQQEGRQENSVLIDGRWQNVGRLAPLGNLIAVGANIRRALESGDPSFFDLAIQSGVSSVRSVADQPFLQGVQMVTETLKEPEQKVGRYVQRLIGSAVPTGVAAAARAMDPVERERERSQGLFDVQALGSEVQARIPGLRERMPTSYGTLGEPRTPIEQRATPWPGVARPDLRQDPLVAELGAAGYVIPRPTRERTETAAGYSERARRMGTVTRAAIEQVMGTDAYARAREAETTADALRESEPDFRTVDLQRFREVVLEQQGLRTRADLLQRAVQDAVRQLGVRAVLERR